MNKEKIKRSIIAVGIGFGLGFVTDRVASGSVSDVAVRQDAPVAILPTETVLFAPPKRLKK